MDESAARRTFRPVDAKPCCVVLDDDTEFLEQVRRYFMASCLDYDVVSFSSSVAAAEFVRRERVDLILTAYLVPQIAGLQFISLVRSWNIRVPILMLSHVPVSAVALARGATAFLAKGALWSQLGEILPSLRTAHA